MYLIVWRLMVNGLVEVVHAEESEGHLLIVLDVLLGQEVLVGQELVFILVARLVQHVVVVKDLREDDVERPVVVVVLHQLVAFDHGLLELVQVVLEQLQVRVAESLGLLVLVFHGLAPGRYGASLPAAH